MRFTLVGHVTAADSVLVSRNVAETVSAGDSESLTCKVNLYVPVTVGVPEIVAVADPEVREIPAGSLDPAASDQVYGAQPPVAEIVVLYLEFRAAFGKGLGLVMLNNPGAMVRLKLADALAVGSSESVTTVLTAKLPTWHVVPEMVALGVPELNANPEGNPELVHEYGVIPPEAVTSAPAPELP